MRRMAGWVGLCALLGVIARAPAWGEDAGAPAGSVAISTVAARQGSLAHRVVAYGIAGPAPDAASTISVQLEGRVAALNVAAGQVVRGGEALLTFAVSAGSASVFQQAVSALSVARSQRAHTQMLVGEQLATRDQLAQADKAVSDAQSTLDALRVEGGGAESRTVTAPFDGVVTSVAVSQGDHVTPGTALMVVSRQAGMVVQAGLEPDARPAVRVGEAAVLQSLDDGSMAAGQVRAVGGALDPKTHLVTATIGAASAPLLGGGAYRAVIEVGRWDGWIVPHDAVLSDDGGFYLFQRDGGTARKVAVQVLGSDAIDTAAGQDVVRGGIVAGRPIILDGAAQLQDGGAVHDAPAADDAVSAPK